MKEGDVVITCDTNQAGTLQCVCKDVACVLLRSGYIWMGNIRMLRLPQPDEDLSHTNDEPPKLSVKTGTNKRSKKN